MDRDRTLLITKEIEPDISELFDFTYLEPRSTPDYLSNCGGGGCQGNCGGNCGGNCSGSCNSSCRHELIKDEKYS